jgi:polyisoprenyl-phosphate glycosyltransferase
MDENFYIVVPCHNEENNINLFIEKISTILKDFDHFRIIFVDDGSTDQTWTKIKKLFETNPKVIGIKLSKNFGKDSAIDAGLSTLKKFTDYSFAIIIDADLQHPIEKIPEMINEWKKNYKIVTTFKKNNVENFLRKLGSDMFYYFMSNFSDVKFITKNTDFMLIDKDVIKIFNKLVEKNKSLKTFINWTGYKNKSLGVEINKRHHGRSKFNFFNLFRTAINAITSFSLFPIKIVGYMGLAMSIISMILIFTFIISNWFDLVPVSIQTIIIIFNIFLTGITLSAIGLLGIYISRIHEGIINRPSFIVEDEKIQ